MAIKKYVMRLLSGLFLGMSLMSPFLYSTKMGLWLNRVDMVQRQMSASHHIVLTPLFLIVILATYIFLNSSKYAIYALLQNRFHYSEVESKNEMDIISLIAHLVAIILFASVIFSRSFPLGINDEFVRLTIIITILIIGITINHFLDKRFRYHEIDSEFAFIHYILAVLILILNAIALAALVI